MSSGNGGSHHQVGSATLGDDLVQHFQRLWMELQVERANQAAIAATLYAAGAALLALDGVWLVFVLDLGVPVWCRLAAAAAAFVSAVPIGWCLFAGTRSHPRGSLEVLTPEYVRRLESRPPDDALLELYTIEMNLVSDNLYRAIFPKLRRLHTGVQLFVVAVLLAAAGELQDLADRGFR